MNPSFHHVSSLEVLPCNPIERPNQFGLRFRYKAEGDFHYFSPTYVSEGLQDALLKGDVKSFHIETLELNSATALCLGCQPRFLMSGLVTRDNSYLVEVPTQLRKARAWRLWGGLLIGAGGLFSLGLYNPWIGAALVTLGSHTVRTALRIPTDRLRWLTEYNKPDEGSQHL